MSGVLKRLFSGGARDKTKAPQELKAAREKRDAPRRVAEGPDTSRSGQAAGKENAALEVLQAGVAESERPRSGQVAAGGHEKVPNQATLGARDRNAGASGSCAGPMPAFGASSLPHPAPAGSEVVVEREVPHVPGQGSAACFEDPRGSEISPSPLSISVMPGSEEIGQALARLKQLEESVRKGLPLTEMRAILERTAPLSPIGEASVAHGCPEQQQGGRASALQAIQGEGGASLHPSRMANRGYIPRGMPPPIQFANKFVGSAARESLGSMNRRDKEGSSARDASSPSFSLLNKVGSSAPASVHERVGKEGTAAQPSAPLSESLPPGSPHARSSPREVGQAGRTA